MYPELPNAEQLQSMTAAELRTLALKIREARRAEFAANPKMSADEHDAWLEWGNTAVNLASLAADKDAEELEATQAAAADRAREALAAEQGDPDGDGADDDEDGDDDDEGGDDGDEDLADKGGEIPTGLGLATTPKPVVETKPVVKTGWNAGPSSGLKAEHEFADYSELGALVQEIAGNMGPGTNDKRVLAQMRGNYADTQKLSGDQLFLDLSRLSDPDEIEAAFCPPGSTVYNLSCANVTRRPVFNGLPQFTLASTDRGSVKIPESPSLYDVTTGWGQWTIEDDADPEALKTCAEVECVDWNTFEWYSTYRCLKVKNMSDMVFPELTAAYLNRLQAQWARFAEVLLLEAMGNASTNIDAPRQAYGANVSLQRIILTYLGLYQDLERWDVPVMDAWMPRWLLWALRMDIASRRKDGSGRIPSIAEVESTFRDVGVEPHWYMDRPSWATPFSRLSVSGDLNSFPSQVEILVHRRGKFAVIDKGVLNLGLGGNPIRIDDDVLRNQHTYFFESFEGLVDTDSCPAHILTVPGLCYNGAQIADSQIECEGYNMVGVGSGA